MDRRTVLDRLAAEAGILKERFGVEGLALFGSIARGEDREGSDLDVLVRFEGRADFDRFMGLKFHLEDLFGRPVDLVTPEGLRPELRPAIEREAIHVA